MNFAVFSDDPCHVSYVKSVPIPIGHTKVELYEIEPGARTRWIVVKQVDGYKNSVKVFLRQNERFLENSMDQLSRETKKQIMQRFPTLAAETRPCWQVRRSARGSVEWLRKSVKKLSKAFAAIERRKRQ